jgi:hypothetical protein
MMMAEAFDQATESGSERAASEATIERTIRVGEQCRLVVENPRGQIHVTGWDRPEVHLRATKRQNGSSAARFNATRIEVSHDGNTVSARTVLDGSPPLFDRGAWGDLVAEALRSFTEFIRNTAMPAEVIYDIQVPRHADVELKGVTSQIWVEDVRGIVHANSVSGAEVVDQVQGDLTLSTVSGSITGRRLDGYVDAKSVSGGIRLEGRLEVLKANNVSGSMELVGPLAAKGSYDFHTVSGSLTLRVPLDTSASISARGVSMAVTSELPCQVLRDARGPGSRQWQGRLNGGDAAVHVNTVSGHLYLAQLTEAALGSASIPVGQTPVPEASIIPSETEAEARPREPDAEQSPPPEPTSPEADAPAAETTESAESAQLRILRAIERGELDVEEALKQLDSLRGQSQ